MISLVVFYGVYIVLGAVAGFLMLRYARRGLDLEPEDPGGSGDPDEHGSAGPRVPALTY